ncbi:heme o synthase [Motiliproteus sp. SC1-56]|uniref:heme o synthase n=1 Tax=Motiliproteus sp. SC1-56 TaxID=2799565 RepID=UPI001A8D3A7F|nr:heme o synthase [Motiliproteus sp. SC1-56]
MILKSALLVRPGWRDLLALCKLRVVSVLLVTALVGLLLARPSLPPLGLVAAAMLGIGLLASAAAALNHLVDRRIDGRMRRTQRRPLPEGRVAPVQVLLFACLLATVGVLVLTFWVNPLTAWLTLGALVGYALVYSYWLKRATPQNIVIGGLAGAAPPLLGWVAVTGQVEPQALLLVAIVYVWTPPHFWALCLHKRDEYAQAGVPMLPVTHGERVTREQITVFGWLQILVTLLPFFYGSAGWLYLVGVLIINARFLYWLARIRDPSDSKAPIATFVFSIKYILLLFLFLLLDHYRILFSSI